MLSDGTADSLFGFRVAFPEKSQLESTGLYS
jgi:hypothetical protein